MPGRDVTVTFLDEEYKTVTDTEGSFELWMDPVPFGGPYSLTVSDDAGESVKINDVLVGEVWLCSGQSNMELPMRRVADMFPDDIRDCNCPMIRTFKITEAVSFTAPLDEVGSGEWKKPSSDTILDFSALGYYFARELNTMTGIPVGFIDASLGGSPIHSWMSRQMLEGYDDKLAAADKYADDAFRESVLKDNIDRPAAWHRELDSIDAGLKEHWESATTDDSAWDTVTLPGFLRDTSIGNFLGCIYFRRTFEVPKGLAGKRASLWLGTLVDSDITYINGVEVGLTEYQYPPRKYDIPEGLLKEGTNNITVRLKSEYYLEFMPGQVSGARFTPGKEFKIFNDELTIDLKGEWKYKIGAVASAESPRQDFVSWKPVGLYNGMTAPCHKYTIRGVNWYQGESDCEQSDVYTDLFRRMVRGYRQVFENEDLRFYVVQLPNFTIDNNPDSPAWTDMREILRTMTEGVKGCDNIVAIDLGEDNDLHPQDKKGLGHRLALLAAHDVCGMDVICHGPSIKKFICVKNGTDAEITLNMTDTGNGLTVREANSKGKDGRVTDLYIVDDMGDIHDAHVTVMKDKLILNVKGLERSVKEIRYCYSQTNTGALIYNSEGLPMSPGRYML
ncbi:MAG: hypothetical protein K5857_07310 [Lachnospiraceae bacterium]|nr:hypothetical protein [Lachnospiraceae bacterium]